MRAANRLLSVVWLLVLPLSGCQDDGVAPWVPSPRRELTTNDYGVYSAWLAAVRPEPGGTVLVGDRTTSTGYPGLSLVAEGRGRLILEPPLPPVACPLGQACPAHTVSVPLPEPPSGDEATQDFRVQRELSLPLERRLEGAVYDLVRDPIPDDLLSDARVVVSFSRVGFNRGARVAVFEVAQADRGDWGWLPPRHYAVRAERVGRLWVMKTISEVAGAAVGVAVPAVVDSVGGLPGTPGVATVLGCRVSRFRGVPLCTGLSHRPGP